MNSQNKKIQIWSRNNEQGLRVIYPSGLVLYCHLNPKGEWSYSCCSRRTRDEAVKAIQEYDRRNGYWNPRMFDYYDDLDDNEMRSFLKYKSGRDQDALPPRVDPDCRHTRNTNVR